MKRCAGAATPDDTRCPDIMNAIVTHKCCAANAVIVDDLTVVGRS